MRSFRASPGSATGDTARRRQALATRLARLRDNQIDLEVMLADAVDEIATRVDLIVNTWALLQRSRHELAQVEQRLATMNPAQTRRRADAHD